MPSIYSDFLTRLNVPHTQYYTDSRFAQMPYAGTLKGFADLLDEYDIDTSLGRFATAADIAAFPMPFMAMMLGVPVIVTKVDGDNISIVKEGAETTIPIDDFIKKSNRKALLAKPDADSHEPEVKNHRQLRLVALAQRFGIPACLIALIALIFIFNGLWRDPATALIAIFDIIGIYICYLLLGKQLHISNATGDSICGFLEKGGCGKIMERNVSKIFGVIGWGEVGMAYFAVSLVALFAYPPALPYLAFFNACCLPYTVWSISYQKFVAKTWCTLCVTVQTLQWLLFGSYLLAHAWHGLLPVRPAFFILGIGYLLALLVIDRILPIISNAHKFKELSTIYSNLRLRSEVFEVEQQQQPPVAPVAQATAITFGTPATDSPAAAVTFFIDPTADTADLHRQIDILLKKHLPVSYIFLTDTPEREQAARNIIALYLKQGAAATWQALGRRAVLPSDTDFFKSFGLTTDAPEVTAEIERHRAWQEDSYVYATPTIIVNDRLLNPLYKPEDLIYIY